MQYKSSNLKYTNLFLSNLVTFVEKHSLFSKDDYLLIAVSGGVDSIALTFCLSELKRFGYSLALRVIHINHSTRPEQIKEEELVKEFCKTINVECITDSLKGLNPNKNFEYSARLKRYDSFYKVAKPNEKIILAHHIDDSFEWTMLQSLRSSNIEGLVGIPVKNNRVIRPFMCCTKRQIEKFADCIDLPYLEDPTNEDIKYERNFIRKSVIPAFKYRYKKYLKHYVYRHNEIARRLGVHLLDKNTSEFQMSFEENSVLIYSFFGSSDLSGLESLILNGLKHLNKNSRGSTSLQFKKVIEALKNGKFGPLSLTNGFKVYLDYNMLLLTKEKPRPANFLFDKAKTYTYEQFLQFIKDYIISNDTHCDFPFFVTVEGASLDKRKFNTSFNIESVEFLRQKNINYFPALKLLRQWSKKQNRHRVLRINILSCS